MDGVIQIFTHRGTTRVPGIHWPSPREAISRRAAAARSFPACWDGSIIPPAFPISKPRGRDRTMDFATARCPAIFGWRFSDSARLTSSPCATTSAPPALPARRCFSRRISPIASPCTISAAGCTLNLRTGSHWHHQVSGTELYNRELNFDPVYPSFYQYNRSGFSATVDVSGARDSRLPPATNTKSKTDSSVISACTSRRNNQAGFLDARWQPIARLTLNAGARAEDNADYGTRVVPRAGASYALRIAPGAFGDTRLHASYGQGIVEPDSISRSATIPAIPAIIYLSLNRAGRSTRESSRNSLPTACASPPIILTAAFATSSALLTARRPRDVRFGTGTFFNTNLASARGANFSGEARIAHWLSASANYTYDSTRTLSAPTDPADLDPNYLPGSRLLRRPVNSGNAMLNASLLRMNWNLSGYFTGQRFDYNYPGQIINPGYARFDLAASYNAFHGVSFYGRIANLANKQYQEAYGLSGAGAGVPHRREIHHAP